MALLGIIMILQPPRTIEAQQFDVRLTPVRNGENIEIVYRAYTPISQMKLPFPAEQFTHLSVSEKDDGIAIGRSGEGVALIGAEPFGLVSLLLAPTVETPAKDYPVAQFGNQAVALNLKYFQPIEVNNQPVSTLNSEGAQFQWLGGAASFESPQVAIYTDAGLPTPVVSLLAPTAEALSAHFQQGFGTALPVRPSLMFLYQEGNDGQLSVEGDVVPGQAVIKYVGGAFQKATPEMQQLVLRNLAHEIVHLWQLQHPKNATAPDWLHEGVADALASEALYISGVWDDAQYLQALTDARSNCAQVLVTGTVRGAASRGHHGASYACGHMAMAALATRHEEGTSMAMWRAFLDYAARQDQPLSEDTFFAFVEEWAGDRGFALSFRSFVTSNYRSADGESIVDQLFAGTL